MTKKERYAGYQNQFNVLRDKHHWDRVKPNPNHWPIIDKWNTRYIYNPSRHDLFVLVENALDTELRNDIGESLEDVVYENINRMH